ncbi:MAG: hypothetical protein ACLFPQ_02275 [Candidatus Woesearchaeota archaeon]
MKYPGKEKRLSKKAQKKIESFLDMQDWNKFYEDRIFGGQIFEEAKRIEDDLHNRIGEI